MRRNCIDVVLAAAQRGFLEACLRDLEIFEPGPFDQALRVRDVLRVEIIALAFKLRIGGGNERKPEALAEAELQHALGAQRAPRRAARAQRGKCHVIGRGLGIKAGGIADICYVASGPIHMRITRLVTRLSSPWPRDADPTTDTSALSQRS